VGFFFFGASLKKNQSLFKLGVVSHRKTTYRFGKNNVSFWKKQRIVLKKTTCHFNDNDSLFFIGYAEGKKNYRRK